MNRENKYSAFTLVEMLIVMGIIIVLMGVGITAGRFAINRANDVAHQNAVDQIYQALQAYYTDNREYPMNGDAEACSSDPCTVAELVGTTSDPGVLGEYMDSGSFDGGTEAGYAYYVDSLGQSTLVCVTLGGAGDVKLRGVYCNGNGFNDGDLAVTVPQNEVPEAVGTEPYDQIIEDSAASVWDATAKNWGL